MQEDTSINLMARWRAGDQLAAEELFQRYAVHLIALASGRLSAKVAQRVDPEDVVQSAYRSFFVAARNGSYNLERGGDLWQLLVSITLHKLHDQVKRNSADKRDVSREAPPHLADGLPNHLGYLLAHGPSPLEAVALADEVEQLLRGLTPLHRSILEMRLQGYHLDEIAERTHRSVRTVCRVLDRLKQGMEEQHKE